MQHDTIAVIDFGGQYAHLIATKVRRLQVRADIVDPLAPLEELRAYKGIILSGSPSLSAYGEGEDYTKAMFDLPIPILGLCFGHQEIAKHYGGKVAHDRQEYGFAQAHILGASPIFAGLGPDEIVWMSHGDSVVELPDGFRELAYSTHVLPSEAIVSQAVAPGGTTGRNDSAAGATSRAAAGGRNHNAAIVSESLKRYGFQFHPEVDDTEHGQQMLENFTVRICGCRQTWTISGYVDEQMAAIRRRVGDGKVFLLASGGVDSSVCARLLIQTLGRERVHLLHIDNGFMRKDESRRVIERFRGWGIVENLHFVDASDRFLEALAGIVDPEKKRIAIGNTFIEVCQVEMERLGVADALLAQGTIYPDTIETGGTSRADVIKTHHNRVPLVEEMVRAGKVLEPIRDMYKVEVRELGAALGLPRDFLERHPYPGPGLGVRLLCAAGRTEGTAELGRITREAQGLARRFGLGARALPVRSVGVKGDLRAYEWPVFLCGAASWEEILEAANHIYKEVDGVNRCCYDLTENRHAAAPRFEVLPATVTRERLDLLREADAAVMEGLDRHDLMNEIWQCPTVLLPVSANGQGRELVVVRPVLSERAMTARPARLPAGLVAELRESILPLPGVSGLCLDVTTKPPGTIEWE
jgi:GMP synthase (glutamine-hydrolysing)